MYTPYDYFQASRQKQAVDALVPGQVGMGPTVATTGAMDSDGSQASNTDVNLMRAQQSAVPILSRPDADGGAGYSHPAPGTSAALQMFADVKAANEAKVAAIIAEGTRYADEVFLDTMKQANMLHEVGRRATNAMHAAGGAPSGPLASAGQYAQAAADHLGGAVQSIPGQLQAIAGSAASKAQEGAEAAKARMGQMGNMAGEAANKARAYMEQGARSAVGSAASYAAQEPLAAIGIGAGGLAAAGGGGALANHVMAMRQAEASKQASQQDPTAYAAQAGAHYALQCLGLV